MAHQNRTCPGFGLGTVTPAAAHISPGNPGGGVGRLTLGNTSWSRATLRQDIHGLLQAADYDQIVVLDALSFDPTAGRLNTLDVQFGNNFVPTIGNSFVIFDNRFAGAIGGHFARLPEGAVLDAGGSFLQISYAGGDGNDVVLTAVVPEPAALASLAAVAVAMRRRARARSAAASPDHRPPLASSPARS